MQRLGHKCARCNDCCFISSFHRDARNHKRRWHLSTKRAMFLVPEADPEVRKTGRWKAHRQPPPVSTRKKRALRRILKPQVARQATVDWRYARKSWQGRPAITAVAPFAWVAHPRMFFCFPTCTVSAANAAQIRGQKEATPCIMRKGNPCFVVFVSCTTIYRFHSGLTTTFCGCLWVSRQRAVMLSRRDLSTIDTHRPDVTTTYFFMHSSVSGASVLERHPRNIMAVISIGGAIKR